MIARSGVGLKPALACSAEAGPVRHRRLRKREDRHETVSVTDVEEHAFGQFAGHPPRREVDDEERLAADECLDIGRSVLSPARIARS